MANLEAKDRMSPLQLAVMVMLMMVGVPGAALQPTLLEAGHGAWLSVVLAGAVFYGAAWLMLLLGGWFPGESFAQYLPRVFGRWAGGAAVWLFVLVLWLNAGYVLQISSRVVTFFMFDRTPFEVVAATLLAVCVYCALQEWGTILRVGQLIFFTAVPIWLLLLSSGLLSFRVINLLPLWPDSAARVVGGALQCWPLYGGFEIILMLFPLVYRGNVKPAAAVAGAFLASGGVFLLWVALMVGVLTLEGVVNIPFPLMTVMRNVEIPGTFLERLDTYFLLFWIQTIFMSLTLALYAMAKAAADLYGHADHRPWVLAFMPAIFLAGDAAHNVRLFEGMQQAGVWVGGAFSLAVVPLICGLVWWRRRQAWPGRAKAE